jgi:hypothetical protein
MSQTSKFKILLKRDSFYCVSNIHNPVEAWRSQLDTNFYLLCRVKAAIPLGKKDKEQ